MDLTDHKVLTELVGADNASTRGRHHLSPAGRDSPATGSDFPHSVSLDIFVQPPDSCAGPSSRCARRSRVAQQRRAKQPSRTVHDPSRRTCRRHQQLLRTEPTVGDDPPGKRSIATEGNGVISFRPAECSKGRRAWVKYRRTISAKTLRWTKQFRSTDAMTGRRTGIGSSKNTPDYVPSSSCSIDRVDCAVGSVQRAPNRSEWAARCHVSGPNPVPVPVWSLEHEVRT